MKIINQTNVQAFNNQVIIDSMVGKWYSVNRAYIIEVKTQGATEYKAIYLNFFERIAAFFNKKYFSKVLKEKDFKILSSDSLLSEIKKTKSIVQKPEDITKMASSESKDKITEVKNDQKVKENERIKEKVEEGQTEKVSDSVSSEQAKEIKDHSKEIEKLTKRVEKAEEDLENEKKLQEIISTHIMYIGLTIPKEPLKAGRVKELLASVRDYIRQKATKDDDSIVLNPDVFSNEPDLSYFDNLVITIKTLLLMGDIYGYVIDSEASSIKVALKEESHYIKEDNFVKSEALFKQILDHVRQGL